ncbi:hypothetical protein HW132_06670 [Brasilonema sp. CT11]|nr:hypothetical protein [Brasilonema sp. CT11]
MSWTLTINTECLILRPQQPDDYEFWYAGFAGRLPQQYKYDEGQISLDGCDSGWFSTLCKRHQHQALDDGGIFCLWGYWLTFLMICCWFSLS